MREIVRDGNALGLFVEGTRQKSPVPGEAMPGAGMVALQENVAVVPAAIYGSYEWRLWNRHPVSIVWGEPMTFEGIARSGRGYREASSSSRRRSTASGAGWVSITSRVGQQNPTPP